MFVGFISVMLTGSAFAQATRTWVSGVGDDVNPCSRTAPCKTFAGAISKTAPGGEIDVLDPGGFGAVTITKAMTIDGGRFTGGVLVVSTNGIIVQAGANDIVTLRHFSVVAPLINGGVNGVRFLSGAALHLEDLSIYGFQHGVDFEPNASNSHLFVRDCSVRDNDPFNSVGGGGILIKSVGAVTAFASIDNTHCDKNNYGVRAEDGAIVFIQNSAIASNQNSGIVAFSNGGANTVVTAQDCEITGNNIGVNANLLGGKNSTIFLARTTISGNTTSVSTAGGVNAKVISQGTNWVQGNGADIGFTQVNPAQ